MKPVILFLGTGVAKLRQFGPSGVLAFLWLATPGVAGLLLLYELGAVSEWLHARGEVGLLVYGAVFLFASGIRSAGPGFKAFRPLASSSDGTGPARVLSNMWPTGAMTT